MQSFSYEPQSGQVVRGSPASNVGRARLSKQALAEGRTALLLALGERVKTMRAQRGMSRRALAQAAEVSERHLANLETGIGNTSIVLLQQVASALNCSLAEIVSDENTQDPEWTLLRQLLQDRSPAELQRARRLLIQLFGSTPHIPGHRDRIALVGLRGAGKSTLGRMLAEALGRPFIELGREITHLAGCSPSEVQALYGHNVYRRYEHRALEHTIESYRSAIIATRGEIVSDPANFNLLLASCRTVWLQAEPEDYLNRVSVQEDMPNMRSNSEAMEDLRIILASRRPFYARADVSVNTSGKTVSEAFDALLDALHLNIGGDEE